MHKLMRGRIRTDGGLPPVASGGPSGDVYAAVYDVYHAPAPLASLSVATGDASGSVSWTMPADPGQPLPVTGFIVTESGVGGVFLPATARLYALQHPVNGVAST